MKEDNIDTFRQKDVNLRDAISMDEMERPQMPSDLNARLMQRVSEEINKKKTHTHILWPWLAAACVAGVVAIFLTPPKETPHMVSYHQPKPYVCNMDEGYTQESFESYEKVMRSRYKQMVHEVAQSTPSTPN